MFSKVAKLSNYETNTFIYSGINGNQKSQQTKKRKSANSKKNKRKTGNEGHNRDFKILNTKPESFLSTHAIDNDKDNILKKLASIIAENYSFSPQLNISKILDFQSINDATLKIIKLVKYDPNDIHNGALSIDNLKTAITVQLQNMYNENKRLQKNRNKITTEEEIEECKLKLIFLTNNNNEINKLYSQLKNLTGVDPHGIELWLADGEVNVGKIQELINDEVDLDKGQNLIMSRDHLEDIKRILSIKVYINDYEDFKDIKNIDERIKFVNVLALQNSVSSTCRVSQIYVASLLLQFAVFENNMEILKILLELKADPRIKDLKFNTTSMSHALMKKEFIEDFLIEVTQDKYIFKDCKAAFDDAMYNDLRVIEEYENKHRIMRLLRTLYEFDFEDSDSDYEIDFNDEI